MNSQPKSKACWAAILVGPFLLSAILTMAGFFPFSCLLPNLHAQSLTTLRPTLSIRDMAMDPKGRVWMSLDREGIMILEPGGDPRNPFDNRWARMNRKNSGLPNDDVPAIAPEGERGVWFGTLVGGLAYLDHGNTPLDLSEDNWVWYTPETTQQGLPDPFVYSVFAHPEGLKWIGTQEGGLCCLDDNRTPLILTDDRWAVFDSQDGLACNWVFRIVPAGPTSRWIATWGGGLHCFDDNGTPFEKGDDRWIRFTRQDGLAGDKVRAVAPDGTTGVWVASLGGLAYLDFAGTPFDKGDDSWVLFLPEDNLPGINVMDVVVGPDNKKWIATWGGGLACLDDKGTPHDKTDDLWACYDAEKGLSEQIVRRLFTDTKGLLWIATWGDGLLVR